MRRQVIALPVGRLALRRRLILAAAGGLVLPAGCADLLAPPSSSDDFAAAIRVALERGATAAVDSLGKTDGFWGDQRVRIPLPDWLARAEGPFRLLGLQKQLDNLHLSINRAAEQAVPQARGLFVDAVRSMTVEDAKGIVTGGDDSATRYFERKTREPLTRLFLPIVTDVTGRIGLARLYDDIAAKAQSFGLVSGDASIEAHVTSKALDGLFLRIGDEERKIRADPAATGSAILQKVFGAR